MAKRFQGLALGESATRQLGGVDRGRVALPLLLTAAPFPAPFPAPARRYRSLGCWLPIACWLLALPSPPSQPTCLPTSPTSNSSPASNYRPPTAGQFSIRISFPPSPVSSILFLLSSSVLKLASFRWYLVFVRRMLAHILFLARSTSGRP